VLSSWEAGEAANTTEAARLLNRLRVNESGV
jgi:hypothetical protein